MQQRVIWDISRRFRRLSPCDGQVAHVLRTLPPVAARVLLPRAAPRLACVKPAASVHPEPGSNSSLYIFYISWLEPDILNSFKKSTLSIIFVSVLATCTLSSVFSMNFVILRNFRPSFSDSLSTPQGLCQTPLFRNGIAKVGTFSEPANFSRTFFHFFFFTHPYCIILSP